MHLKKLVLASLLTTAAAGYSTGAMAAQSAEDTLYDAVSNGGYVQLSAGIGSPATAMAWRRSMTLRATPTSAAISSMIPLMRVYVGASTSSSRRHSSRRPSSRMAKSAIPTSP